MNPLEGETVMIVGTVGAIEPSIDRAGEPVLLVVLHLPELGTVLLTIEHHAGRTAAAKWKRGDRITAWGHFHEVVDAHDVRVTGVRAHTVRRHQPDRMPDPFNPRRQRTTGPAR